MKKPVNLLAMLLALTSAAHAEKQVVFSSIFEAISPGVTTPGQYFANIKLLTDQLKAKANGNVTQLEGMTFQD